MLTVLVAGLLEHDSGKTWIGLSLYEALKSLGYRVKCFKPVAGHNAWYQYNTIVESMKAKLLVGEDALKYHKATGEPIEVLNPIDVLLAPMNPKSYSSIHAYLSTLSTLPQQLVLARLSRCLPTISSQHYYFKLLDNVVPPLRQQIKELARELKAVEGDATKFISLLASSEAEQIIDSCCKLLLEDTDALIVESFNNAATPYGLILNRITHAIVVTPGYLAVYDGEDYRNAVKKVYENLGFNGLTTSIVVKDLEPLHEVYVPPANSPLELADTIKEVAKRIAES